MTGEREVLQNATDSATALPQGGSSDPLTFLPAAFVQERLFFLHQALPNGATYNIPTVLRLKGPLNKGALRAAFQRLLQRHELLRTVYRCEGSKLLLAINGSSPFSLREVKVTDEAGLANMVQEEIEKPFDLEHGGVIRAALFQASETHHMLVITMHHIASDEWSVRVMLSDLKELYTAAVAGRRPDLPDLEIQYADYAAWINEWLSGLQMREQLEFWKKSLGPDPTATELVLDHPRPQNPSCRGERYRLEFPVALSESVRQLGRAEKTTSFNILYAAFQVLLARYTANNEVLSGTVVAGRPRSETERLIGFFVNLLPIRSTVSDGATFKEVLAQLRQYLLEAYSHQDVPFDRLVAELKPERASNRTPLCQVVFTVQQNILEREQWAGTEVEWVDVHTRSSKFDLIFTVEETRAGFTVVAEYSSEIFERESIQRLSRHYLQLLGSLISNPQLPVWKAEILSPEEKHLLLEKWNATESPFPDKTVHELFAEQVKLRRDAIALRFQDGDWSYGELNDRAENIAARLVSLGAGREVMVGICLERGPEFIAAVLGVLKAGACYVPLDPHYPTERLRYLVQDARATIVLTDRKQLDKVPVGQAKQVVIEEIPARAEGFQPRTISADAAAYVMYTSGSTGKPKGVVVTHRNIVRLVKNASYISLQADEVILQYAPTSFDASTFEIWAPLLNGGQLCIMPPTRAALEDLGAAIARFKVTTLWLTTGLFNLAVDEHIDCFRGLRQVLTGGEIGSARHFKRFLEHHPQCRLYNCYGPTENTTFTTVGQVELKEASEGNITIGKPISNTTVYILDRWLQPVPIGVPGELYAGGAGVAREYLHAPELTREKFVPNPFRDGERLYRTGDLARFRQDGNIHFIGRVDNQLKIRGFRVELGEIEDALRSHPAVREVVVIASTMRPGDKTLIAYWTASDSVQSIDTAELRSYMKRTLPDFLVPAVFVKVDHFELDANGKVNRKALPPVSALPEKGPTETAAPGSLEEQLLEIWRQIFSQPGIGINDNFFDLGGHSLLATQVVSRIRQTLRLDLPVGALFDHSTVADLARFIHQREDTSREEPQLMRRRAVRPAVKSP